jgi:uncharacterized protein YbbC (DUF1343 family)
MDPQRLTQLCTQGAARAGLEGVIFRPAAFVPGFQKHAGASCTGIEVHLTDRTKLNAFLLGMVCMEASWRCDPDRFRWRTEMYEFVEDPIAIDLLCGSQELRSCIEARGSLRDLLSSWEPELGGFLERRQPCLLY